MEAFVCAETDAELKKAYSEMLAGCLEKPELYEWYAMWLIELKDGTRVGDLCFKGLGEDGSAELGYGILEEHRRRGYATEAVKAASEWAFTHPEVAAVEAETEPDNAVSRKVLEKCGFVASGAVGEEGPRFVLTRERRDML